ncbi:hypothetical protein HK103_004270 [Boothiomyces macroporosus]|uniref:Uncharacterized protein n=1 Tax=Boothiomyces macroporosus TaxID=261099 RepID=A0AAD5UGV7_9FUNG|nr:hypothetical protein HK103_004270 [Boothiomyces macroporosus]
MNMNNMTMTSGNDTSGGTNDTVDLIIGLAVIVAFSIGGYIIGVKLFQWWKSKKANQNQQFQHYNMNQNPVGYQQPPPYNPPGYPPPQDGLNYMNPPMRPSQDGLNYMNSAMPPPQNTPIQPYNNFAPPQQYVNSTMHSSPQNPQNTVPSPPDTFNTLTGSQTLVAESGISTPMTNFATPQEQLRASFTPIQPMMSFNNTSQVAELPTLQGHTVHKQEAINQPPILTIQQEPVKIQHKLPSATESQQPPIIAILPSEVLKPTSDNLQSSAEEHIPPVISLVENNASAEIEESKPEESQPPIMNFK